MLSRNTRFVRESTSLVANEQKFRIHWIISRGWKTWKSLVSQARSPGRTAWIAITVERVRNIGRSCYARRSCGRCPDYKRIAFSVHDAKASPPEGPAERVALLIGFETKRKRHGWSIEPLEFSRVWCSRHGSFSFLRFLSHRRRIALLFPLIVRGESTRFFLFVSITFSKNDRFERMFRT